PVRSLAAFEQSEYADDWRDLMRLFLVRRTRSFIQENYAQTDPATKRKFLVFNDGRRSYFPARLPRTVKFLIDDERTGDPYALLYADDVVETINSLNLPRYGLGNYIAKTLRERPTPAEAKQLDNLSHAGKRLMGFCRTNLFKRLESGGPAFIQSIERHILRNYVFLHAIEEGLDLPLGTQDADLLDARTNDEDEDALLPETAEENEGATPMLDEIRVALRSEDEFRKRASQVYGQYAGPMRRRFKWLRPTLFNANLKRDLLADARGLSTVLVKCGTWDAGKDAKLAALLDLLTRQHGGEKVLVFTQFADTVRYLSEQLQARGVQAMQGVTGDSADPTELAWRFSPVSNNKRERIRPDDELRVLVATDVLSEGQNLQDAAIVVNYDLPWAIIRLIQRAGRVDRIGQQADTIYCYSFLPAEGVERLIRLRERVRQRLQQNAEVVGTDEAFFEDELTETAKIAFEDLYNEKAGVLDGEADSEVDLASQAYQIWKNAIDANPRLRGIIEKLPDVIFSTRAHRGSVAAPEGVLLYMRTSEGNDALAWVNRRGENVTQSQLAILRAAACSSDTAAIARPPEQHDLVKKGVEHIIEEETRNTGGQLGAPSGARRRTYERLKQFVDKTKDTLLPPSPELYNALEEIYKYPLQETAKDTLNRQLRSGITDDQLAELVINLRADNRLCQVQELAEPQEPQIICSLGLFDDGT
ncbi:MAG TPA: C-terminal helicase domain-containing protein, partial [Ktedonobacteraceae bacterium]|nr:C-terminal helicase domain-containing protein [Ktedonobacteraceae bacterium]